jgi:hypothetical protein
MSGSLLDGSHADVRAGYDLRMRRVAVYLTVIALLIVALGAAWLATDWPYWCRWLHWCDGRGLL